jgi:hypothetical protein
MIKLSKITIDIIIEIIFVLSPIFISTCFKHCNFLSSIPQNAEMVKLSLCLTNQALRHGDVWGCGCIDPRFLGLGTSWR